MSKFATTVKHELHEMLVGALDNDPGRRLDSFAGIAAWSGALDDAFLRRLFS